jgi:hypothetical protein
MGGLVLAAMLRIRSKGGGWRSRQAIVARDDRPIAFHLEGAWSGRIVQLRRAIPRPRRVRGHAGGALDRPERARRRGVPDSDQFGGRCGGPAGRTGASLIWARMARAVTS